MIYKSIDETIDRLRQQGFLFSDGGFKNNRPEVFYLSDRRFKEIFSDLYHPKRQIEPPPWFQNVLDDIKNNPNCKVASIYAPCEFYMFKPF